MRVGDLGSVGFFEITPQHIHMVEIAAFGFVFDTSKQIALDVYRVHAALARRRLCKRKDMRTASRAKIRHDHAGVHADLTHVRRRMSEVLYIITFKRHHIYSIIYDNMQT